MTKLLFIPIIIFYLSGCGQSGPLYLPPKNQTNNQQTDNTSS